MTPGELGLAHTKGTDEMTTVYVVMYGDHPDVMIAGVFSSLEKAEELAAVYDGWVDEYELDAAPYYEKGKRAYAAQGNVGGFVFTYTISPCSFGGEVRGHRGSMYTRLWAVNQEEAISIAKDRFEKFTKDSEASDDPT